VNRSIEHKLTIPEGFVFQRLDQAMVELLPQYSRSLIQQWIKEGNLLVDSEKVKPSFKLVGGEQVLIDCSLEDVITAEPEAIPIDVIFEDDYLLVINKPVGMVVHPGAGNDSGTLMNALLNHDHNLAKIPRAGIIHRLDKNTSGLLLIAKTNESQNRLVKDLQSRVINRIYYALVYGRTPYQEGNVSLSIGRHPKERKKMSVRPDGKSAKTHYRVIEIFEGHCFLECKLETGRTHQIRVHMQALGNPLIGDNEYGGHFRRPRSNLLELEELLRAFSRQALHARKLSFRHPETGKDILLTAPIPEDFERLLETLREAN